MIVIIFFFVDVWNLFEFWLSKGDVSFNLGEKMLEWYILVKDFFGFIFYFGFWGIVVGFFVDDDEEVIGVNGFGLDDYFYNELY